MKAQCSQPASPSVCSPEKTGFCDYESLLGSLGAGLGNTSLKMFFILCSSKVGIRSKGTAHQSEDEVECFVHEVIASRSRVTLCGVDQVLLGMK